MPGVHTFYDGSRILEPIAERIGVEFDMHLIALIAVSYAIMCISPTVYVHKLVFVFAMSYLIFIHWFRWYILTSYSIDITGPMMVVTQKVTTMAFSLHDGRVKKAQELSVIQKKEALCEVPSVLEYLSYIFHFQTVLTGPLCFYADYKAFIDGTDMSERERKASFYRVREDLQTLNVLDGALPKLAASVFYMAVVAIFHESLRPEVVLEPEYWAMPFYKWWIVFWLVMVVKRFQYYYAWTVADAIANLSGFGFNGYDENHKAKWNLISNVNVWQVEMGQNFKTVIDNWNCSTVQWLRRVAYDRVPKNYRTVSIYLLSSQWHGFFIGYYQTFLTAALFTITGRVMRECLRHRCKTTRYRSFAYDVLSFLATKMSLTYTTFPFATLHLNPGFFLFKQLYFSGHIIALLALLVVPVLAPPLRREPRHKDKETEKVE